METLIVAIVLFVVFLFLMRLLGAWMLRINELITLCKKIIFELKEIRTQLNK